MNDLTTLRQPLAVARENLNRECAALTRMLELKRRQLAALEFLLADDPGMADETVVPRQLELKAEESDKDNSLTGQAKEVLKQAGRVGVRPRDVMRKLRDSGANPSNQFASNLLWKMKTKDEVVELGGRYYLKDFDPRL